MFDTSSSGEAQPDDARADRAECSGAVLATVVAGALGRLPGLPDTLAGDAEAVDLASATMRVEGWALAARAKAIAQVYSRALAEHQRCGTARASHGYDNQAFTRSEIAVELSLEMGISLPAADAEVRFALLVAKVHSLGEALATGRVHATQARAMATELAALKHSSVREQVAASLVGDPDDPEVWPRLVSELRRPGARVWTLTAGRLKAIIRREAARLDPDSVRERAAEAAGRRHVRYYGGPDNTSELVLHGPSPQLAAAIARLTSTATAARAVGEPGTLDQLRFDLATACLTDGLFGLSVTDRPRPRGAILVNVTVPDTTMAGGDQVGVLHGPDGDTPLPPELARELAYDPAASIWRQIRCDPVSGQAVDVSQRYRPSQHLTDLVICRDGYRSRFPGSTARRVELDHVREFDHADPARGGPTNSSNVASEGLREHRVKTDRGFFIEGDADGCLTYRTRTGRTYDSWPHQHMRPLTIPAQPLRDNDTSRLAPSRQAPSPHPRTTPQDWGEPPF